MAFHAQTPLKPMEERGTAKKGLEKFYLKSRKDAEKRDVHFTIYIYIYLKNFQNMH